MIPKIIHQIWFKPPLPERYEKFRQTWIKHHPGWEYRLWTNANLPGMANRHIFDQLTNYGGRADLLRYELLYWFGGWYADLDTECFQPIDALLENQDLALVYEDPPPGSGLIANCFMGAAPHHAYLRKLLTALPFSAFRKDWPIVGATGPGFMTHHAKEMGIKPNLPHAQFLPFSWNEKHRSGESFPGAYAVHHWDMGWRDHTSQPNIS